jgi:hypothetical protein
MQNYEADLQSVHHSRYLRTSDPFYPCALQKSLYQPACYYYAPIFYLHLHPGGYVAAMTWCRGAGDGQAATCTKGLGSRTLKYNLDRETWVEQVCDSGVPWQRAPCLAGVVSYYKVNYHSEAAAAVLCRKMTSARDKVLCRQAAGIRSTGQD